MNNKKSASDILRERYLVSQIHKANEEKRHPSLNDIAGFEYLKDEIVHKIYNPLFHPEQYHHLGAVPPRSLLIRGVEGSGKSFLLECFSKQYNVPILSRFMASIKDIKEVFMNARSLERAIIMVKNIDHIVEEADLLYQLKESISKINTKTLVVFLHRSVINEIKYDNEIFIKIPNTATRKKILDSLLLGMQTKELDTFYIAQNTPGFVPGNLVKLLGMAVTNAIARINKDASNSNTVVNNVDKSNTIVTNTTSNPSCNSDSKNIIMQDFELALKNWKNREDNITFDDIGALDHVKEELEMSILLPSRYSEKFARFGITRPSGVLLYGPPGCGKTLIAKAVSCMSHCNFLSIKGPELITKYVGDSEKHLRDLFEKARNMSPCVLFFDEIDSLCSKRGSNEFGNRIVNQILTLLDGIDDRGEVYIIGATNRIERIDPALMRSGRFDKIIEVPLPTLKEAQDIFKKCITKVPHVPFDFSNLNFANMSGADIAGVVKEAAILCLKTNFENPDLKVDEQYFKQALEKFRNMKKTFKRK